LKSVTVVSEAGFVQLGAAEATPADVREKKANNEKIVTVLFLNIVIMNASYEKCVCRYTASLIALYAEHGSLYSR